MSTCRSLCRNVAETIDKAATLNPRFKFKYPKDSKLSKNQKRKIRRVFNKCRIMGAIDESVLDALARGGRHW